MAIKVQNLTKWALLNPKHGLRLKATDSRKVRLDVNCPEPTRFDVVVHDKPIFLAVVTGMESLEFVIEADAEVIPTTDGEVWYFTNEGGDAPFEVPDAVSFVEIMNRRARNPQLEEMMYRAELNMNRRLEALDAEYASRLAALGHDPNTGEVHEEVPDDDTGGATGDQGSQDGGGTGDQGKATGTGKGAGATAGPTPAK